jgi:hypothetical protein
MQHKAILGELIKSNRKSIGEIISPTNPKSIGETTTKKRQEKNEKVNLLC